MMSGNNTERMMLPLAAASDSSSINNGTVEADIVNDLADKEVLIVQQQKQRSNKGRQMAARFAFVVIGAVIIMASLCFDEPPEQLKVSARHSNTATTIKKESSEKEEPDGGASMKSWNNKNVTLINLISNYEGCNWEEEYILDLFSPSEYVHEPTILRKADGDPNKQHLLLDGDVDVDTQRYYKSTVVFLVSSIRPCHRLVGGLDAFNDKMNKLVNWYERKFNRKAIVIHTSDECGHPNRKRNAEYSWYDNCAVIFRQYQCGETIEPFFNNNAAAMTSSLQVILPLGWRTGQMQMINSLASRKVPPKKLFSWGWAGTVKSDREKMLDAMTKVENGFSFRATATNQMTPEEIFDLYQHSVFVPIGRGYVVLDCFRIYTALYAGAIPVVVGSTKEIRDTFSFLSHDNDPESNLPFVFAPSWEEAAIKVNSLLKNDNHEMLAKKTREWWYEYSLRLQEHVAVILSMERSSPT
jgi:hypothetical protein